MKILHTSDWHLGKKIEGKDRIEEQRQVLLEICGISERYGAEIILVCGDIFDTCTPSAEAEDLFYDTLCRLSDGGNRLVAVIAGNHDDPVRLCAASSLAQRQAIMISGGGDEIFKISGSGKFKVAESGKGYAVIESAKGEKTVLNYLAYPSDSRLGEYASDIGYSEKIAGYLSGGSGRFSEDTVNIIISHLFAAGALPTGEEREIQLGGVKVCSLSVFPKNCHYVALGHIHRHQKMAENVYYSGSILQYSVDESSNKSVIMCDISAKGIKSIEKVPLISGRKVISYTAESVGGAISFLQGTNDYVYLTIKQDKPLLYGESKELKRFGNLLSIDLDISFSGTEKKAESRKNYSPRELFTNYYASKFNSNPNEELVNLFLEISENDIKEEI